MRHAKSSWDDESLPDEERPLNERGKAAAIKMGKFLRDEDLVPDLILTSPAKRARQTADRVKEAGRLDAPIVQNPHLYFAGAEAYFDAIETTPNAVHTLLVIGHNPDIESLLARITRHPVRMPTAAIAQIAVAAEDWRAIRLATACKLKDVYRPKELAGRD